MTWIQADDSIHTMKEFRGEWGRKDRNIFKQFIASDRFTTVQHQYMAFHAIKRHRSIMQMKRKVTSGMESIATNTQKLENLT